MGRLQTPACRGRTQALSEEAGGTPQVAGSAFQELALADPQLVLYRRGERSGTFTLILQGRVLIHTGALSSPSPSKSAPPNPTAKWNDWCNVLSMQ